MAYQEVWIVLLIAFALEVLRRSTDKIVNIKYFREETGRAARRAQWKIRFSYIEVGAQMEAISKCWFVAPLDIGLALIQIGANVETS